MQYWHVNLRPNEGRFSGSVFHFELVFPDDYPSQPPTVHLMSTTMPGHPNVFGSGRRGFICLSMLRDHTATTPNEGWTSAYSVFSLLLQLQRATRPFFASLAMQWGFARIQSCASEPPLHWILNGDMWTQLQRLPLA